MHPGLEQHWEIKKAGKNLRDLEGEYRAAQHPSKSSNMKPQHGNKVSHIFQQPLGIPRQTKPPVNPETLKRALDAERDAETARRNALSRFHEAQRGLPKSAIREVTNPWITRPPNAQNPGNPQPPSGPSRGRQPGNNPPGNQHWTGNPKPPSGPSGGRQSGNRQPGNYLNQPGHQQWTGYQPTSLPSHSRQSGSTFRLGTIMLGTVSLGATKQGTISLGTPSRKQWRKKRNKRHSSRGSHAGTPRQSPGWQQAERHNQNEQRPVNQAQSEQQQPVWGQQPPEQNQGQGQNRNLNLNAGAPQKVKQERGGSPKVKQEEDSEAEESDIEITGWRVLKPARSSQPAAPEVNNSNDNNPPQRSAAATRTVETPRQRAYRPLPTPTSFGASTPGPRPPPPPPRGQDVQPEEPTRTPVAATSQTVMMDMIYAMHISITERLDRLDGGQMLERQQQQLAGRRRAPRPVTATEVNQQRTGVTQELEYIFAPVRGDSDDSNDGTYAPSTFPGEEDDGAEVDSEDEEEVVVLPSIESDKLDESDGSDDSDESDESEESEEAEEPEEPAGHSTPPRQKGQGKRKATEWSVSPSPVNKKPRQSEEKTKVKETPIPVPFLERAIRERARVDALVQAKLSARLLPYH
ncbi:hypothetical protein C8A01DRAFT_39401 [Parachaetomium inaequale]|uniref:Uncharacterized protein n=1 Tax=Parachaetomium inaequale TaxID=2588326 RepID=A0AAN6P9D5_9PEZI|nr:hypothetical protein C8A01DRAFT_39401 [Parachaetomium inaequale]